MNTRPASIRASYLKILEKAAELLVKHRENDVAAQVWTVALDLREQTKFGAEGAVFLCDDIDESAGMAEVHELQNYSRKVPLKGCGA